MENFLKVHILLNELEKNKIYNRLIYVSYKITELLTKLKESGNEFYNNSEFLNIWILKSYLSKMSAVKRRLDKCVHTALMHSLSTL